jgi:hypothetical protein
MNGNVWEQTEPNSGFKVKNIRVSTNDEIDDKKRARAVNQCKKGQILCNIPKCRSQPYRSRSGN